MRLEIEPRRWRNEFKKKYGKEPRVLMIGNVANNAYQIAKALNREKIDCDVLCHDYYHIMGTPEWEDAEIEGEIENQFFPDFDAVNMHGYKRPKWFAQGPLLDAVDYLTARRRNKLLGFFAWKKLERIRKYVIKNKGELPLKSRERNCIVPEENYREYWKRKLAEDWAACFPDRKPIEWTLVCDMFLNTGYTIQPLLARYDIVAAFSECVLLPYFAGCQKYLSFEHGTIRGYPTSEKELSNLAMLAYAKSSVLINTNIDKDCYHAAKYITGKSKTVHFCGLHGIGVDKLIKRNDTECKISLRSRLGIPKEESIIFCPVRNDYEKGIDKIHAALRMVAEDGNKFIAVMVNHGSDHDRFKKEIDNDHVLKKHIRWVEPLPKREFIDAIHDSDIVLDQFAFEGFGGISIETMTSKKAVLISHATDKNLMKEWFSSPYPILEANSAEEIKDRIEVVIKDKGKAREIAERQFQWVCKEHSTERISRLFCGALKLTMDGE